LGSALVPEGRALVPDLSVRANLILGTATWNRRYDSPAVSELLEGTFQRFPILGRRRHQPAGSMSGGEQQMLAIARALMARPSVLMLDEPSLGLAPKVTRQVFTELAAVASTGTAVLVAEQNTTAALRVATRTYVMDSGSVVSAADGAAMNGMLRDAFLDPKKGSP
jgi:branched-chain amino acid transport system ATP-binding protein